MQAERWRQLERLFHSALERAPGERAALLAEACAGDEELRRNWVSRWRGRSASQSPDCHHF
jgi:hypothetical protein